MKTMWQILLPGALKGAEDKHLEKQELIQVAEVE